MHVPNVVKARTVVTQSGLRVNWKNVSYFEIQEENNFYQIGIKWKYKASIKTEYLELNKDTDLYKYFKQHGIVKLGEYYVNLNKIITIQEKAIHGPHEKVRVRFLFTDGFELVTVLTSTDWVWWKTTYA